jgi:hypothetical protein
MSPQSGGTAPREIWIPTAVRYFPIVLSEAFLLMTIAVFAFGPWGWPVANPVELYSFLFINQLALLFGYIIAVRRRLPSPFHLPIALNELVWLAALATLVMLIPTLIVETGGDINIARALTDPGQAYGDTRYAVTFAAPTIVEYINILLSPLIWALMPLAVVFWSRFSLLLKSLAVVGILGGAFIFLLIGTNKRVVDIMLLLPWLLVIRSKDPSTILTPKRLFLFFSTIVVALILFLPYFAINISGRGTGKASTEQISVGGGALIRATPFEALGFDGPVAQVYGIGYTALASYVGQGYYGLSLALQEPFVWTYGVGHSRTVTWLAEKAMAGQYAIQDTTYPSRVERDFGWNEQVKWCSLYPWLAGDVTFFGVPIVVFLFGRLLGLTWLDALGRNPVAVVLFCLTCLTVFYISANAQVFQASNTVFVFYFYLFWWIQSRGTTDTQWRRATVSIPGY